MLDSCCSPSATVLNFNNITKCIWDSLKSTKTATLGGQYTAPYTADYEYFGTTDMDEDLPMSIISWYRMLELGAIITKIDNGKIIRFKNMPITLRVEWTDGVLAGDLYPLIDFIQSHTDSILLSQWSARSTRLYLEFQIVQSDVWIRFIEHCKRCGPPLKQIWCGELSMENFKI